MKRNVADKYSLPLDVAKERRIIPVHMKNRKRFQPNPEVFKTTIFF